MKASPSSRIVYKIIHRSSYFTILFALALLLAGCPTAPPAAPDRGEEPGSRRPPPVEEPAEEPAEEPEAGEGEGSEARGSRPEREAPVDRRLDRVRAAFSEPEFSDEFLVDRQVQRIINGMSLEEKVGQLIFPAIMTDRRGRPVTEVTEEVRGILRQVSPGGILLFGPNFTSLPQTRSFLRELQELSEIPLVFAVDQEGGVVSRLTESRGLEATRIPAAATVGAAGDLELARAVGAVVGAELRALGIVMNLAPVADVNTNPANPVIRERAYGSDAEEVSRVVAAVVEGMQSQGVAAVLKHFPGHGDTYDDTHLSSATVYHSLDRLRAVEFLPFEAGIEAGALGVMSGHISVPGVTGGAEPATFSPLLLTELLREELGFDGLVVTDSLAMAALINYYPQDEIVYRALEAGNDILLRPLYAGRAYQALLDGVASGRISEERVEESVRRILKFKFRMGLLQLPRDMEALFRRGIVEGAAEEVLGAPAHWDVVRQIEAATAR
ncbi:MAG: glycoside hydrolase family 3 protein [Alkalispirochaetaceae bacterium]